jgi:archaemetzincin
MKRYWAGFLLSVCFLSAVYPQENKGKQVEELHRAIKALTPSAQPMSGVKPGDWLSVYNEPGQTFEEYLAAVKINLGPQRKKIYIQPVGDFTPAQQKIEQAAAEFLGIFYNLPIESKNVIALADIPREARRKNPLSGQEQILTRYVMEEKIFPFLPKDTAAYLAFTATDLWTGEGSNFVFGEASADDPVGIWSMARYGNPDADKAAFQKCLLRALKVATHETGHMFGLMHCTMHSCGMNGYNSLAEEDSHPLAFCPECIAKLCWVTKTDIKDHCRRVAQFLHGHGLEEEARAYETYLQALEGTSTHSR